MKRTQVMWFVLAGALIAGPVVARMAFWPPRSNTPVDPVMAEAGKVLFTHEWQPNDPLSPGGDGLGPVFNARSCVACHKQGGVGGGGGLEHNVTTFLSATNGVVKQGVIHSDAVSPQFQETLQNIHLNLPPISKPTLAQIRGDLLARNNFDLSVEVAQRQTPALFGANRIDRIPDRVIIAQERAQRVRFGVAGFPTTERLPVGRALLLAKGKVGKFGWKAQSASVIDFVEAACANELGLSNPGQNQPVSLNRPEYRGKGLDLTTEQCQQIAAFIGSLPEPRQQKPDNGRDLERVHNGQHLFGKLGCADCHVPNLDSIPGIYSDLLLHRMGRDLEGRSGGYNGPSIPDSPEDGSPLPDEWRTPPLWGVADSAPYMHDGRAPTLEEAIRMHGGQAQSSASAFNVLSDAERNDVIAFLRSLRAPY